MNAPTDFTALKSRQQTAWASGDYAVIGTTLELVGELLAEACDLRWDECALDVACGTGLVAFGAAQAVGPDGTHSPALSVTCRPTGF
jgi:predicted RNA methylase